MAYTDKAAALTAIKALPAVRDLPVDADDSFLNGLLSASAGTVPEGGASDAEQTYNAGATVYRHYYVAARFLETLRSQHVLSKGGSGVEFTGLATPIASLMSLQQGIDLSLGLEVPSGFGAVAIVEPESAGSVVRPLPLGSGSRKTTVRP
jgi:hypothetical protein